MSQHFRNPGQPGKGNDGKSVNNDWRPSAPVVVLQQRAALVDRLRAFFKERQILEVDTPVLQGGANLDYGVVPFHIFHGATRRYLPTSPEHALKRLVAAGIGDCWTLAPAFRCDENGNRHASEFRMVEWYRLGWDDIALAGETVALCATITGRPITAERIAWRDAFKKYAGLDPFAADMASLHAHLGDDTNVIGDDRNAALDLILTRDVEPHLGKTCWTILTDYPASACAQARIRTDKNGESVAARFEIYADGIELANGYHELIDGQELKKRQLSELQSRNHGEQLDERFLAAMAHGLPDCAGVAVGFDRLVMIALGLDNVSATQAFGWDRA